jgi:hypothetical protein
MIISISAQLQRLKITEFCTSQSPKNADLKEESTIFEFYQHTFVYKAVVLIFAVLLEE